MKKKSDALLRVCTQAARNGADFPTIWNEILKKHPLVAGIPIQGDNAEGPVLEIRLTTGQWLVFGSKGFSIKRPA